MIRRCLVIPVAWALRRGITPGDMMTAISRTFPHRDSSWRLDLLGDAIDRNRPAEIDA